MTPLQRMLCVMVLMRIYGSIAENALCNGFFRALMRIGGYCRECSVASFRALMRIVWLLQRMLLCLFVVVSVPVVCALIHGFWRLVFSGVGSSRCVLKQFGEK